MWINVIYVDIINHLPACVGIRTMATRMSARLSSSSSPGGLERLLVILLLLLWNCGVNRDLRLVRSQNR